MGGEEAPTGRRLWLSRQRKFGVKIISARLLTIRLGLESELAEARATCIFPALGFVGTSSPLVFDDLPSFCRKPLPSIVAGSGQHTQEALISLSPDSNLCNVINLYFEALNNELSSHEGFGELSQSPIPGCQPLTPAARVSVCDYVILSRGDAVNLSRRDLGSRLLVLLPVVLLINRLRGVRGTNLGIISQS